jgi:hypothetical protein
LLPTLPRNYRQKSHCRSQLIELYVFLSRIVSNIITGAYVMGVQTFQ